MRKTVLFLLAFSLVQILSAKNNGIFSEKITISSAGCSGNADAVSIDNDVVSEANALGVPDDSGAFIENRGNQLGLDLTDIIQAGETYTIRWRRSLTTSDNPVLLSKNLWMV